MMRTTVNRWLDKDSDVTDLLQDKANGNDVFTKDLVYQKTDVDGLLSGKVDTLDVYTKDLVYQVTEVDDLLLGKADTTSVYSKDEVYTKTEVADLVQDSVDGNDVYTKEESDAISSTKVDTGDVYDKPSSDNRFISNTGTLGVVGALSVRFATNATSFITLGTLGTWNLTASYLNNYQIRFDFSTWRPSDTDYIVMANGDNVLAASNGNFTTIVNKTTSSFTMSVYGRYFTTGMVLNTMVYGVNMVPI
jgi:hypothetical protein